MTPQAGDIAWAEVDDVRGNKKLRPIVIIDVADEARAVAITTSPTDPSEVQYVALPFHASGNVTTRLRKQSWAACHWLLTLRFDQIVEIRGHVPPDMLLSIRQRALE